MPKGSPRSCPDSIAIWAPNFRFRTHLRACSSCSSSSKRATTPKLARLGKCFSSSCGEWKKTPPAPWSCLAVDRTFGVRTRTTGRRVRIPHSRR